MPVTVGLFVGPGHVPVAGKPTHYRDNRGIEYEALSDDYVRFLLDELLPCVVKEQKLNLSTDGNDRAIAGASSGGICAFTAAWQRPDAFCRVFSSIGSFSAFRGGSIYPTLVRMYEPKPIRIFLQDGRNDLNIAAGDWWLANQEMERALSFCGYEVTHSWDDGGHNTIDSSKVFPDAMRWLWKDWPNPVKAGAGSNHHRDILLPNESWKPVGQGYGEVTGLATSPTGEVVFSDVSVGTTYRIGLDAKVSVLLTDSHKASGQAFGPDGRLYVAATAAKQILAYDASGNATIIADGIVGRGIVVGYNGNVYATGSKSDSGSLTGVWFIGPNGEKRIVDSNLERAAGITLLGGQSFLCITDPRTHWTYSYLIQPDGLLARKQRFHYLGVPDAANCTEANGMCIDRDGRLYIATNMGIQVCDNSGRRMCIIATPNGKATSICFGGIQFDTLFAACGNSIFQRRVKVRGACAFQPPIDPKPLSL